MSVRILGGQRELHAKHLWLLQLTGFDDTNFQKCSELSTENAEITYPEGGSSIPWKMPGKQTFADVTLERGTSSDAAFYQWAVLTSNAAIKGAGATSRGSGAVAGTWTRHGTLYQLDRDGVSRLRGWTIKNAWVKKFVAGDWDATADEVVIESLTLAMDWFELEV